MSARGDRARAGALLALLALAGCAQLESVLAPAPSPAPATVPTGRERRCLALEFDSEGRESTRPRERISDGVAFRYVQVSGVVGELAALRPACVFVICHGWMNDTSSAREFTGRLVQGLCARAPVVGIDPDRLAFLGVHWDSEEVNFYGSADTAERIGRRRLNNLLADLRAALPGAPVVLVGHSLGARLVLSALQGRADGANRVAGAAVLLEGAVDQDALVPGSNPDDFGRFPVAPDRVGLLFNVHSSHDAVLEHTYARALQSPALGLVGAARLPGQPYPGWTLTAPPLPGALDSALNLPAALTPQGGGRVVNVNASAVVSGHSEIFGEAVVALVMEAARLASSRR